MRRRILQLGSLGWALAGTVVALASLGAVNDDARILVGVASVLGPALAIGAAELLRRRLDRSAGTLLVLSALLTPTYFAYALNLPALVAGIALVARGEHLLAPRDRRRLTPPATVPRS